MMPCPACGREVGEQDRFCIACGVALTGEPAPAQEQTLYRYGPMGISIQFGGRPGVFRKAWQNVVEVVLTNQRLCGLRRHSVFFLRHRGKDGELVFNVPWNAVVAYKAGEMLVNKTLWVQYREGEALKEVSIIAAALRHQHVQRSLEIMSSLVRR
ncbi:MAG: zinc ribbon domain-containing protein [Acidobacteriota bacterium]